MTGAGTPNSNYAGRLNTHIYYATTLESATQLLYWQGGCLGYPLMQELDTLYRGIGLAHPL